MVLSSTTVYHIIPINVVKPLIELSYIKSYIEILKCKTYLQVKPEAVFLVMCDPYMNEL